MILLPLAVAICFYALFVFLWRSRVIALGRQSHIDDRNGPLMLAGMVVCALIAILIISLADMVETMKSQGQDLTFVLSSLHILDQ